MATLTAKQQRALSQAPKRDRARLQQLFQNQNSNGNKSQRSGGRSAPTNRTNATRVLTQGAAAVPTKAFGAGREGTGGNGGSVKNALKLGLNARLPYHLGLPRPVGPYQVIRTSHLYTSSAEVIIFAPIMNKHADAHGLPLWMPACGIQSVVTGNPINASANASMIPMPLNVLGPATEVVPAAMTVQVMVSESLQNAKGVHTMARVNQQMNLGGDSRTWEALRNEFNSYFRPRLLTGGKLALRGVTCNAIPLDMGEYSEFAPLSSATISPTMTWEAHRAFAGLSPIVFTTEPAAPASPVSFLITIEWRVRFDPMAPAAASHVYHPPTPDGVWGNVIKAASNMGHGVEDIADSIADVGAAVGDL